jgi:hypothetical protein
MVAPNGDVIATGNCDQSSCGYLGTFFFKRLADGRYAAPRRLVPPLGGLGAEINDLGYVGGRLIISATQHWLRCPRCTNFLWSPFSGKRKMAVFPRRASNLTLTTLPRTLIATGNLCSRTSTVCGDAPNFMVPIAMHRSGRPYLGRIRVVTRVTIQLVTTGADRRPLIVGLRNVSPFPEVLVYPDGKIFNIASLVRKRSGWTDLIIDTANDRGQLVGTGKLHGRYRIFIMTPLQSGPPKESPVAKPMRG